VALLHYGYLHKEDRIQKYRWLISIDPHNEGEDFYQHCVQGDLPEFPADATYKHGGPLRLQRLPAHLVPKFDVVPGPRAQVESWATPGNRRAELSATEFDYPLKTVEFAAAD
jgi:hypothetical protein